MAETVGFYTDTTVCIGCKACQVACHQWNDLPSPDGKTRPLPVLSGDSYDNTTTLSDTNWRHVKFIEQFSSDANRNQARWLMMSDVCKHCVNAPCLEVCPTGAYLYGADDKILGGLNAFYLLVDKPEVYGLPSAPKVPSRSVPLSAFWGVFAALLTALGALFAFRSRTPLEPAANSNGGTPKPVERNPVESASQTTTPPPQR